MLKIRPQNRFNKGWRTECFVALILLFSAQQGIASLSQQSHKVRRKAKELLEIAKKSGGDCY